MSVLGALVLGIVQGLTEFLPVSSSGHLVLGQALLGLRLPGVTFEIVVHVATLCSVVWVYRARIVGLATGMLRGDREDWTYVGMLLLASVPAGMAGSIGAEFFEAAFGKPIVAAALLAVTGFLVWSVKRTGPGARDESPGPGQALWIGFGQALAILPGISRSGTTVAVGAWRGVEVVHVAEFSFLLSIPAIAGAALLKAGDIGAAALASPAVLGAGFIAALVSGVLAIRLFIRTLEHRTYHRFAYYCWAVSAAYLLAALAVPELR